MTRPQFLPLLGLLTLLTGCATTHDSAKYDAQTVLSVTKLDCQGCGQDIAHALQKTPGIANVVFDKRSIEVTVSYRKADITPAAMIAVVETAGFGASIGAGHGAYAPHVTFDTKVDAEWITRKGSKVDLAKHLVPGKVTVIDFGAEWCGPCRKVDEMMTELLKEMSDVALRKVDIVDWDTPVSKQFLSKVPELPFVIVFNKEGKEVTRFGGLDLKRLRNVIEKAR